jgi:hypothetical protein
MVMQFKKAERKQAKLRLGLTGPSGSGKTYSALLLAFELGQRVAVIDTENSSAALYAHLGEFESLELEAPYSPERFIEAIKTAEKAGFDVLIIDSLTHEWSGPGGCLEINELIAQTKFKGNTWSAWSETTPRHRKLLDTIVSSPMHIIVTLRSKTETVQGEGRKIIKLGMKSEQRDGFEYELTVVLDLTHDGHFATATKDRTGIFADKDPAAVSAETGRKLLRWLNSGAAPAPQTQPEQAIISGPSPHQVVLFKRCESAILESEDLDDLSTKRERLADLLSQGKLTDGQVNELRQLIDARLSELVPSFEESPI